MPASITQLLKPAILTSILIMALCLSGSVQTPPHYYYQGEPIEMELIGDRLAVRYRAAAFSYDQSAVTLENCIIAFNSGGQPVSCYEYSSATATCTDVYGNTGSDWVGCLAGQDGANGNFSSDPLFCNLGTGKLNPTDQSPCAPANNDREILIGALETGCICDCTAHGDLDLDGVITPLGVTIIVNYVYIQLDSRAVVITCPGDNGDWDCNGPIDPLDVSWYVNYVCKTSGVGPCDPYPENCPPTCMNTIPKQPLLPGGFK